MIQILTVISAYSAIFRLTGSSICCVAIIPPKSDSYFRPKSKRKAERVIIPLLCQRDYNSFLCKRQTLFLLAQLQHFYCMIQLCLATRLSSAILCISLNFFLLNPLSATACRLMSASRHSTEPPLPGSMEGTDPHTGSHLLL